MTDLSFFENRRPGVFSDRPLRRSAVMIPVLETSKGQQLLFEQRSEALRTQPGDICFPGGQVEDGETPRQAALREICEELLVEPGQVRILGPADVFAGAARQIHPFVCVLSDYAGDFNRDEVARTFTVPLAWLLAQEPKVYRMSWKPQLPEDFPFDKIHGGRDYGWRRMEEEILFYEYGELVIWGLTAKLVRAFVQAVNEAGDV